MNTAEDTANAPSRAARHVRCTLDELVARAQNLSAGGSRKILGITGAPGAGKSTVADAIAQVLGERAARVGMDAFHLANSVLDAHGTRDRKGAPETFDPWGYANLLRRLKSNAEPMIYAPVFDRRLEESIGSAIPVDRVVPLIITEGNYLLLDAEGWREGCEVIDEIWYLEVPQEERQQRLVRRHEAFGKSRDEAQAWAKGSDQLNADVVDATRERADLVITLVGAYRPESLAQA